MKLKILPYVLLAPLATSAYATGRLKLESDGFLRSSDERPNATQTLSIGPHTRSEGSYLSSEVDLQANVQVTDSSTFTPEASNLYVATSPRISHEHQLTVGRRTENWSEMDDRWEAGIYSPRFIWDPTRPQKIGLTGLMYQYRTDKIVASVFGSAVDVPERGFPIREENGKIVSSNPFNVPLPDSAEYQNNVIPIRYHIHYPPIESLVVNPGGVARIRVQESEKRGPWAQLSGGYMPIHQPYISIEDNQFYNPTTGIADIQVYPSIQYHRLLTLESGFKTSRYFLWGSVTQEKPEKRDLREDTFSAQMEEALIGAVGGGIQVSRQIRWTASFLHVDEQARAPSARKQVVNVDLPGRFTYKRAIRSGVEVEGNGRMSYAARWIYDLAGESHLTSFDTYISMFKQSRDLTLNLGADFFISSAGTGAIGQYKGNDRVRGGVSYVF